jgi:hypothetical protein
MAEQWQAWADKVGVRPWGEGQGKAGNPKGKKKSAAK